MDDSSRLQHLLDWFAALGPHDSESNNQGLGHVTKLVQEQLGLSVDEAKKLLDELKRRGYIENIVRPGFKSGIYVTRITDRGRDHLERSEDVTRTPPESSPLIFISCGQFTEDERALGETLAAIVNDKTSATGYFAQNQSSLQSLTDNVLNALNRAAGFIGVLHHRGDVTHGSSTHFMRASVWIEQEVAIAAFLAHVLKRDIPVQLYIQRGIKLEGIRDKLMLNPKGFDAASEVTDHFTANASTIFASVALPMASTKVTYSKTSPLEPKPWPLVSLTPQSTHPDFILGLHVRPVEYLTERKILDADDEKTITAAEVLSRGPQQALHMPLSMRRSANGVVLATPETNERRSDGSMRQPEQQLQIDSDGEMTLRFFQTNDAPLVQLFALYGAAYVLIRQIYPVLGLKQVVRVSSSFYLNADRQKFNPVLPTQDSQAATIDLQSQAFPAAFLDLTLLHLRSANASATKADVRDILAGFAEASLPTA